MLLYLLVEVGLLAVFILAVDKQRAPGRVCFLAPFEEAVARPVLPCLAVLAVFSVAAFDVRVLVLVALRPFEEPVAGLLVLPDAVFFLAVPRQTLLAVLLL